MPLTEEEIDELEAQIPELAQQAFRAAFERALACGYPVTVLEGYKIVERTKDGGRKVVGVLPEEQRSKVVLQRRWVIA